MLKINYKVELNFLNAIYSFNIKFKNKNKKKGKTKQKTKFKFSIEYLEIVKVHD